MSGPTREPRANATSINVVGWVRRCAVVVICMLLLAGAVWLTSRYTTNRRLMQLERDGHSFIDWRGPNVDWLNRIIGAQTSQLMLSYPAGVIIGSTNEQLPDQAVMRAFAEFSGLEQVQIHNRDLPRGCLELIAVRNSVELLTFRLPVITPDNSRTLSSMKGLRRVRLSQFVREPRENDWSWLNALPKLESLEATLWGAADRDVIALAQCSAAGTLSLSGPMSDVALVRLCDLPNLYHLSLGDGDFAVHFPAGKKLPAELKSLELNWTAADDESLASIAGLSEVNRVSILGGQVSDDGLRVLAKLPALQILWLESLPKVTDAGLKALTVSSSLQEVHVRNLGITARGLVHLMNIPTWADIRFDDVEFRRTAGTNGPAPPTFDEAEDFLTRARERQQQMHQELNLQRLSRPR